MFENQLAELKAYGYNTLFFGQLYDHYMNGAELPENPIIITFDDGYESNYTLGYPVLKKYGMNACVFMITNDNHFCSLHRYCHHCFTFKRDNHL
jgi:peptidoglycan/xylan/chitin deacetylase (PgdA/CDA1 family)